MNLKKILCLALLLSVGVVTSHCKDVDKDMDNQGTQEPETGSNDNGDFDDGTPVQFSDAIFAMDYVPHEETAAEITAREGRLKNRQSTFFTSLEAAIAGGTIEQWLDNYIKQKSNDDSTPYLDLAKLSIDYGYTALAQPLINRIKPYISLRYAEYKREAKWDMDNGFASGNGVPRDLNTVHPGRKIVENAYVLKLLNAYDNATKTTVEEFIDTYVEGKANYYQGKYKTTGYNKEIFATDIAFWVSMLYKDEPAKYPLCKASAESIWDNVINVSYDADNSPHYDAATGVKMVLNWGLLNGKEQEMKNSIHIKRILDRMSRTIMNSGQTAKYAKSMSSRQPSNAEYVCDASAFVPWDLKIAYRLYNDPFYLYVARKYEDLRYNAGVVSTSGDMVDTYPLGINYDEVTTAPLSPSTPSSYATQRITSKTQYNGLLLGRNDSNYESVQDKLIISTGHHPRAPYCLIDLSYSQHKAAQDHRMTINSLMFDGAHTSTVLGRAAEGFRNNRPVVASKSIAFPIMNFSEGDVTVPVNGEYQKAMKYDPRFDFKIADYGVKTLSPNAAYGYVEYSKFQYDGISALRRVVLLHNGIAVVYDRISSSASSGRNDNVGVFYNLWPAVTKFTPKWVLQAAHTATLVEKSPQQDISTLFYFPRTNSVHSVSLNKDPKRTDTNISTTLCCQSELAAGGQVDFITLIIPMKDASKVDEFTSGIATSKRADKYTVSIPSPGSAAIKVTIGATGDPEVSEGR